MTNQKTTQIVVVPASTIAPHIGVERASLFNPDGTPLDAGSFTQAAFQADSVAADVPTLVSDFNDLLAKLQAAGIMASS